MTNIIAWVAGFFADLWSEIKRTPPPAPVAPVTVAAPVQEPVNVTVNVTDDDGSKPVVTATTTTPATVKEAPANGESQSK